MSLFSQVGTQKKDTARSGVLFFCLGYCSVLAEQAVKAALSDYYRRQGIDPEPIVGKLEEDCEHCESCGH